MCWSSPCWPGSWRRAAWRTRSVQLLTLGSLGLLASDVSFGLLQLYSSFHPGTATDLGWLVFYAAWGAAALHPTMTTLTEPIRRSQPLSSPFRLVLIMVAALVAPVVLFVGSVRGQVIDAGVIAVCSALLYLLVLSRLADVAAALRRALVRAEVLRQAGAALAGAATVEQAADAVRSGVGSLLRVQPEAAVLAVREEGRLRVVGAPPGEPPISPDLPAAVTDNWPSLLAGPASRILPIGDGAGSSSVLLCPLALQDRPSGDPLIGVLAVFGPGQELAALSGTLEVLARQAAWWSSGSC